MIRIFTIFRTQTCQWLSNIQYMLQLSNASLSIISFFIPFKNKDHCFIKTQI